MNRREFLGMAGAAAGLAATGMAGGAAAASKTPGEHRAIWCHSAFGVKGMTWDEAIKRLADSGFTAILPNMLWGGVAFYKSDVLPVAKGGDQIAACAAACTKYGVQCHVWKVNWNMGRRSPREFAAKMQRAGRTQVSHAGKAEARWLCPSHPANQKLEIDAMVEVARKYDVAGVHFDYIRYPNQDYCFCDGCRQRFAEAVGRKAAKWPADVLGKGALREKWLDFRRANITKVVSAVAAAARKARPGVKISAAVFKDWPVHRDSLGQDWKLWCEKGYLDFVCPMNYTSSSARFERAVRRQLGWAGKVPCYPGIGLSTPKPRDDVARLIEQVKITRRLGTGGFTVFALTATSAGKVLPAAAKALNLKR